MSEGGVIVAEEAVNAVNFYSSELDAASIASADQ